MADGKSNVWSTIGGMIPFVGGAISALGNIGAAERQRKEQEKLTHDQVEYAKQLADYNQGLSMKTWHETNVGAQKQEYINAGMNPALMYGGSGGTGTTAGGSMPMPTGGQAANSAATTANKINMGMQLAQMGLVKAQTENVQADTAKKEGEATNISADTDYKNILTETASQSLPRTLEIIASEAMKRSAEAQISLTQEGIQKESAQAQIQKIRQEALNAGIEATAMKMGIELDKAKINEITNGIAQKWKELNIQADKTGYEHEDRIKAIEEYTRTALITSGINAAGNLIGDLIGIYTKAPLKIMEKVIKGRDGKSHTETTTFGH